MQQFINVSNEAQDQSRKYYILLRSWIGVLPPIRSYSVASFLILDWHAWVQPLLMLHSLTQQTLLCLLVVNISLQRLLQVYGASPREDVDPEVVVDYSGESDVVSDSKPPASPPGLPLGDTSSSFRKTRSCGTLSKLTYR